MNPTASLEGSGLLQTI